MTAHLRRCYCSGACNTRAWRQRHPEAARAATAAKSTGVDSPDGRQRADALTGGLPLAAEQLAPLGRPAAVDEPEPVSAGEPHGLSFGKLVAATAIGTLLADTLKHLVAPTAPTGPPSTSGLPSWPPPALLAAAGPAEPITNPAWPELTGVAPVSYQRHRVYLCVVAGVTWVLWESPRGEWYQLTTPADLAWLAALPLRSPEMQALIDKHVPDFEAAPAFARVEALLVPPSEPA
ncbi:hypothetical protein A8B98_16495 [Hymenobacter sp. UV11]|nr:hypothetical protein A8B98_16495 [Hymenobacter sp. UV11]